MCNRFLVLIFLVLGCFSSAFAVGVHPITPLPWHNKAEVLEYQTCGCADSCWIAKVFNKKTRRPIAKLTCNCEKVFVTKGHGTPQPYADDCAAFEGADKFKVITSTLQSLTSASPVVPPKQVDTKESAPTSPQFGLTLGQFPTEPSARRFIANLGSAINTQVIKVIDMDKLAWWVVLAGPYHSQDEALSARPALQTKIGIADNLPLMVWRAP